LRHSCNEVHAKLQALGIWFGDSLSLFDHLVESKHEALNCLMAKVVRRKNQHFTTVCSTRHLMHTTP
jgi:hypothetical protein